MRRSETLLTDIAEYSANWQTFIIVGKQKKLTRAQAPRAAAPFGQLAALLRMEMVCHALHFVPHKP